MPNIKTYFEFALDVILDNNEYTKDVSTYLCVTRLAMDSAKDNKPYEFELVDYLIDLSKTNISREDFNKEVQKIVDNLILM